MGKVVEFRSYNLKSGTREEFHRLLLEQSLPLLGRWGVDVVAFGPSLHDRDSYYLIRAYESLADHASSQEAFYGSSDWRDGPRDAIISLIDAHTSFVIEMEVSTVDALRTRA